MGTSRSTFLRKMNGSATQTSVPCRRSSYTRRQLPSRNQADTPPCSQHLRDGFDWGCQRREIFSTDGSGYSSCVHGSCQMRTTNNLTALALQNQSVKKRPCQSGKAVAWFVVRIHRHALCATWGQIHLPPAASSPEKLFVPQTPRIVLMDDVALYIGVLTQLCQ